MEILSGISASNGIGIGNLFVIPQTVPIQIEKKQINPASKEKTWKKFLDAIDHTKHYFKSNTDKNNPEQVAIFETYLLMISDVEFLDAIQKIYQKNLWNLEYIVFNQYTELANQLRSAKDEYLQQRAEDICDVFERILYIFLDKELFSYNEIPTECILYSKSFRPSDAAVVFNKKPRALIAEDGGTSSHLAILSKSYNVPVVFGVKNNNNHLVNNQKLIVDGTNGKIIIAPDKKTLSEYKELHDKNIEKQARLQKYQGQPAIIGSGERITLMANISTLDEAELARKEGIDGIGLFRTELLFIHKNRMFTEEEQFDCYKSILQKFRNLPVTIRVLDFGGDKLLANSETQIMHEENPLLGCRGIRFLLQHTEIFVPQIRALLRASVCGELRIMLPLISCVEEVIATKKLIEQTKQSLQNEKIPVSNTYKIGIMIETASAAILTDELAEHCDFFSIGTNDLTQYTLAVDRENKTVAPLFSEFQPSVLRLIYHTVKTAHEKNIPLSVCGEMASRPEGIIFLMGIGVRAISMNLYSLNAAKELLLKHDLPQMQNYATHILQLKEKNKIVSFLEETILH